MDIEDFKEEHCAENQMIIALIKFRVSLLDALRSNGLFQLVDLVPGAKNKKFV